MSKNQAIQKMLHKSGLCIRKYSPVALSCVASNRIQQFFIRIY